MSSSLNEYLPPSPVFSEALTMQHATLWNEKLWNRPSLASCDVFSITSYFTCSQDTLVLPAFFIVGIVRVFTAASFSIYKSVYIYLHISLNHVQIILLDIFRWLLSNTCNSSIGLLLIWTVTKNIYSMIGN